MNAKTRVGLEILEAALLLGLLGNALLRATPWGLNVLLWIGALVFAMGALTLRRRRELWTRETVLLHGALLFFAAGFAWRDSLTLQTLDALVILVILAISSLPALKVPIHLAGFLQYALGAILSGFNAAFAPFLLIFNDIEWKTIPRRGWTKHALAVVRGLAIAAPILLIFCALFMAADAVFEGIVINTFNFNGEILFSHVFLFCFFAWICAGYLRGALFGSIVINDLMPESQINKTVSLDINKPAASVIPNSLEQNAAKQSQTEPVAPAVERKEFADQLPNFVRLGAVEVAIVLGLINLLFLSFVVIQLRYFFGGMDFVQTTENFKLAEYARRGFFELCWVAALVLPILLTTHFLLKKNSLLNEKLFRALAAVNIGLLFIIMFSAVNRMLLYTGNLGYGMTEMRLYPTAFMLWLALVFLWFGLTVLRGQSKHFAWGALWTALFIVAGLHMLNPDYFIVNHNVKLMKEGRHFDARYHAYDLSEDAIPALTGYLSDMSFENQCLVKHQLVWQLQKDKTSDFRSFNLSRWSAHQNLLNHAHSFDTTGCPQETERRYHDYDF